ncbi:MAG: DUF2784 family protein [Proteobacteria bacterium]|nr:DUF2784 family protein [Pseudomonadota bacterium]
MRVGFGQAILAVHLLVIAFNVAGLVLTPLGAWRGWAWVRIRSWRVLHLASLAVTALQASLGKACFLTVWQGELTGGSQAPLIERWVDSLIYWPLPVWVFATAYVAVFAYAAALWWLVPPRRS